MLSHNVSLILPNSFRMAAAAPAADHPIKRARVSDDDSLQAWTQSLTDHPVIIPPDSDVEEMYDAPLSDWETAVLHDPVLICDVAHEGDSFCSPVHPYFTNPSMDDAQIPPDLVNPLGGTYHRGQGGGTHTRQVLARARGSDWMPSMPRSPRTWSLAHVTITTATAAGAVHFASVPWEIIVATESELIIFPPTESTFWL